MPLSCVLDSTKKLLVMKVNYMHLFYFIFIIYFSDVLKKP